MSVILLVESSVEARFSRDCKNGDVEKVCRYGLPGVLVNWRNPDNDGVTALMCAVAGRDPTNMVACLLKVGHLEINKQDYNGYTALMWALKCRPSNVQMVRCV